MLGLAAGLDLSAVSVHDEDNAFYELALAGHHVREAFAALDRAAGGLDSWLTTERQLASTKEMKALQSTQQASLAKMGNLQQVQVAMQRNVEWIEVFLVGYYALAATYYINSAIHPPAAYAAASMVVATCGALLGIYVMLRPDKLDHPDGHEGAHTAAREGRRWKAALIVFSVILIVHAALAWTLAARQKHLADVAAAGRSAAEAPADPTPEKTSDVNHPRADKVAD
jgi:hypothetical protein